MAARGPAMAMPLNSVVVLLVVLLSGSFSVALGYYMPGGVGGRPYCSQEYKSAQNMEALRAACPADLSSPDEKCCGVITQMQAYALPGNADESCVLAFFAALEENAYVNVEKIQACPSVRERGLLATVMDAEEEAEAEAVPSSSTSAPSPVLSSEGAGF